MPKDTPNPTSPSLHCGTTFRPRPFDVNAEIPVITDPETSVEIEKECLAYKDVPSFLPEKHKIKLIPDNVIPGVQIHIPSFRELSEEEEEEEEEKEEEEEEEKEEKEEEENNNWIRPKQYIVSEETEANDQKNEDVNEYDLDSEDEEFCEYLNNRKHYKINEDEFESLIWIFEKESQKRKFSLENEDIELFQHLNREEDVPCSICCERSFEKSNQIVFCDGCNVAVHQICYGIPNIPEGAWLCKKCANKTKSVSCIFCTEKGGAFTKTDTNQWAHVICSMWIPQIGFGDPKNVEPVIRIDQIPPESWKHRCSICNELEGVCVQCSEPNCHSYYHITCAQLHSFMIEIKFSKKKDNIFLLSYCRKHSLKYQLMKKQNSFGSWQLSEAASSALISIVSQNKNLHLSSNLVTVVYRYWRSKRKRIKHPLLRRYYELGEDEKPQFPAVENYFKMRALRQDLEKLRIILDVIRKREFAKKEIIENQLDLFVTVIQAQALEKQASKKHKVKKLKKDSEPTLKKPKDPKDKTSNTSKSSSSLTKKQNLSKKLKKVSPPSKHLISNPHPKKNNSTSSSSPRKQLASTPVFLSTTTKKRKTREKETKLPKGKNSSNLKPKKKKQKI